MGKERLRTSAFCFLGLQLQWLLSPPQQCCCPPTQLQLCFDHEPHHLQILGFSQTAYSRPAPPHLIYPLESPHSSYTSNSQGPLIPGTHLHSRTHVCHAKSLSLHSSVPWLGAHGPALQPLQRPSAPPVSLLPIEFTWRNSTPNKTYPSACFLPALQQPQADEGKQTIQFVFHIKFVTAFKWILYFLGKSSTLFLRRLLPSLPSSNLQETSSLMFNMWPHFILI